LIKRLTQRISKTDDAQVSYSESIIELDFIQRFLPLDKELLPTIVTGFSIYIKLGNSMTNRIQHGNADGGRTTFVQTITHKLFLFL
jgi:hypothetical protein